MSPRNAGWSRLQRLLGAAIAALVLPMCGDGLAECTLDVDCDQGFACEISECVAVCGADTDCAEDEVCLRGLTTERRVCQAAQTEQVRALFAVVRDESADASCDGDAPGADIAFVLVEDANGDVVAWGRAIADGVVTEGNSFADASHIDGTRPEAGADSCPEQISQNIVALGCGGYLGVDFVDANGAAVELRSGEHKLRVGESGAQCGGSDDDRYEVLLCPSDVVGAENMDEVPNGCTLSVGIGQGERAFEF